MPPRLIFLVAIHLALGCLPFFYGWVPPNVRYMPMIWFIGSVTVAQTMLLGFWMGMGTNPWHHRLAGALLGCGFFSLPGITQGTLQSLAFGAIVFVLGGVFLLMRRWFALQRVKTDAIRATSSNRFQFSIFHVLMLTAVAAVVFGLVRSARLSGTDSVWFDIFMWGLMITMLVINAVGSAWATLAVDDCRIKVAATFLVSFLLGLAICLSSYRTFTGAPILPWWVWLGGIYMTTCLTLIIVTTLLVVRSCGYRLIRRSLSA